MNTVKRWLAGFLSFAMIFTSAAFTNVGAIVTFAASGVEVTATDGTVTETMSFSNIDEAIEGINDYYADLQEPTKLITIKLLGNETITETIECPMIIDLNGFKLIGWNEDFKDTYLGGRHALCVAPYEYRTDGYPEEIIIDLHHYNNEVYNWVYDEGHTPDWYVSSISKICDNCGMKKNVTDLTDYETIYNADKQQYEFRKNSRMLSAWKPGEAEGDDWLLNGIIYPSQVGGVIVKENGIPVVYAPIRKIDTGEQKNVKTVVSAVTDPTEIKEVIKYQVNGIKEGNTAATCMEAGAQIYKVVVSDPNGEYIATTYWRDDNAIPKLAHEKGLLIGYQVAERYGDEGYTSEKAALRAAKKELGEDYDARFLKVKKEGEKYFYWAWPEKDNYEKIKHADNSIISGDFIVDAKDIEADGKFNYRFVYECNNKDDNENLVYDEKETRSDVYPNATSLKELTDGAHSGCDYWLIKPVEKTHSYVGGGKTVTCTFKGTVDVKNNDFVPDPAIEGKNFVAKASDDIKHTVDTKSGYTESGYATCMDLETKSGYQLIYTCNVCGNEVIEYKKVDHEFRTSDISVDDYTKYPTSYFTKVPGDTRPKESYTTINKNIDSVTVAPDCMNDGGTYRYCDGVVYPSGYEKPHGHWAIVESTRVPATGHTFVTQAGSGKWGIIEYDNSVEGNYVNDSTVKGAATENGLYDYNDNTYTDKDFVFVTEQSCEKGCPESFGTVMYHSEEGIDGYDEDDVYHVYGAITVAYKAKGKDCSSFAQTTYTVDPSKVTKDGTNPITLTYRSTDPDDRGPHNFEVSAVNWSDDFEKATITGYCTVDGCVAEDGHPGYDAAIVSRSVDKETGITTFTATYKGKVVDTKKAYTLRHAVVTFDPTKIEDANLVTGLFNYCAPVDELAPVVTVTIDGVEIDNSLFAIDWLLNQRPVGYGGISGVAKTAKYVWADVEWSKDIKAQKDVTVLRGRAYCEPYNAKSNKEFANPRTVIFDSEENKITDSEALALTYDPEKSYSVVTKSGTKDATVKYAVLSEEIKLTTAEKNAIRKDGGDWKDEWLEVQRRIEELDFDLDEVTGLKDAGEFYVYAQITEDGYTTYTGEVAEIVIGKKPVFADVDNVTAIEGTEPEFNTRFYDKNKEVVTVDKAEYTFATLGGAALTALTPGTYKVQIVSDNYDVATEKYGSDYVCVLTVVSMDDTTAVDQAKAKAAADQIEALLADPTAENLAKARELYDKLPASAKARFDAEVLKKLTDAEAAAQAKKDADAAIAAAKGYESDAAVKAALDALNAALAKGDTTEIKNATNTLNAAITAVKDAAAAKDAANAAIAAAKGYESDAAVKAALDALNAALAKGDTAAIKTATANLNNAVTAAKNKKAEKSASKITFSTKKKTIKASKVKKKAQKFQIKIKKTGNGKVTYKKSSGSKKLSVSKSGKITVKKGTKKGTYKIKVKATIAETSTYKKATKSQTIKVKVK